jgi:hypothetical protein
LNILCKKCINKEHHTFVFEFKFSKIDDKGEAMDITLTNRGSLFHALHYEKRHQIHGRDKIDLGQ